MSATRYVFHFAAGRGAYVLTCAQLAQTISARFHKPLSADPDAPLRVGAEPAGPNVEPAPRAAAPERAVPARGPPVVRDEDEDEDEGDGDDGGVGDGDGGGAAGGGRDRGGGGDPPGDRADLGDAALWAAAARLRWTLRADQLFGPRELAQRCADLRADGSLDAARHAVRRLAAALPVAYPALARARREAVVQLAALGRNLATAAGQDPSLFAFVESELQPVALASAL